MATLTERGRDRLRSNQFAYVDRKGGEHLPIHDESHVRNALARFNQVDFESAAAKERARRKLLAAAKRHGIEVSEDSNVAKSARRAPGREPSRGLRRSQDVWARSR